MNNAEKFKQLFGIYATELWAIPEEKFLEWLNAEALEKQETAKIVVGKSKGGVTLWHECSKCGESVDAKDIFCRRCGRKLISLPEPYTEKKS